MVSFIFDGHWSIISGSGQGRPTPYTIQPPPATATATSAMVRRCKSLLIFPTFLKVAGNDLIHPEMQRKIFPILCNPPPSNIDIC